VCVKFLEVSNNWSGVIRFGFTCNDPNNLRYGLPKYACPDLTNKPGYWAKALAERFAERDTVLFYYVTQAGDVHFGINGEEKGVFFGGVETRGPLWAIIDVYGNSTAIELVDPRQQLNNSRRNLAIGGGDSSPGDSAAMERIILPSLTSLSISNQQNHQQPQTRGRNVRLSNDRCIASRTDTEFCHGYVFTARPIQLGEKVVIQVLATEPMYVGALALGLTSCDPATIQGADLPEDSDLLLDRPEYWVVSKDVASCPQRGDELSFCITHTGSRNSSPPPRAIDPALAAGRLRVNLPCSVSNGTSSNSSGSSDGHGQHNGMPVPVPVSQRFCCAGPTPPPAATAELVQYQPSVGSRNSSPPPRAIDPALAAGRLRVNLPCSVSNGTSSNSSGSSDGHGQHNGMPVPVPVSQRFCCAGPTPPPAATAELVQYQPSVGGGTVLVVNLPPAHSNYLNQQNQQNQHQHQATPATNQHHSQSPPVDLQPSSSGTLLSTYSHTYIEVSLLLLTVASVLSPMS
ncbi:hypothetical protein C0J52_22556, partial [Blattella germanica]